IAETGAVMAFPRVLLAAMARTLVAPAMIMRLITALIAPPVTPIASMTAVTFGPATTLLGTAGLRTLAPVRFFRIRGGLGHCFRTRNGFADEFFNGRKQFVVVGRS